MEKRHRDNQRTKCYRWEAELGGPRDTVPFKQIQSVVDHVWASEGLQHPPKVVRLPKTSKYGGDATRTKVRFHGSTSTKTILHELGHSMTMDVDGNGDSHGPHFVGTIMLLYNKYLGIPLERMTKLARERKLKYHFGTESRF